MFAALSGQGEACWPSHSCWKLVHSWRRRNTVTGYFGIIKMTPFVASCPIMALACSQISIYILNPWHPHGKYIHQDLDPLWFYGYVVLRTCRTWHSHVLKRKCRHFDEIFITSCTGICHFDNFQYSRCWELHQYEDLSVSVIYRSLHSM